MIFQFADAAAVIPCTDTLHHCRNSILFALFSTSFIACFSWLRAKIVPTGRS